MNNFKLFENLHYFKLLLHYIALDMKSAKVYYFSLSGI